MEQQPPISAQSMNVTLVIDESWINRFLDGQNLNIQVHDNYTLNDLKIEIGLGELSVQAGIKEKERTTLEMTIRPVWNAEDQKVGIEDLKLKTSTRNILLKSAGWLAQTFLNAAIDKKIEEQANKMVSVKLQKLLAGPMTIPVPKGGNVTVTPRSIKINHVTLLDKSIQANVTIEAEWNVHLT
jgi:hypothetical protein